MRDKITKTAIEWVGTPYQHQVGLKGVGVDCAYLVGKVAEEAGIVDKFQVEPYSVEWHLHSRVELMCSILESFGCVQIPIEELQPGDILAFKYGRVCSHLGIMLNRGMFVHANMSGKKVMLNSLSGEFTERLSRVYKFPHIKD
jgi:NlpC/P60 family putative phage cell wall peptidase